MTKQRNLCILLSTLCGCTLQGQKAPTRPNIIYIIMDDLGYGDLGCFGQEKIETPHIDQLCREGIKLTQHYAGAPVSAPSRCVLMTGLHSGHTQIRVNNELAKRGPIHNYDSMFVHKELEGQFPLRANTMTLGRMLQQAGYTTGCFGKWGLGYPGSEGTPNKQGFDCFYGYNCQRQAHTYYPPFLYKNEERVYLSNKVTNPHAGVPKEGNPRDPNYYAPYTQKEYANDLIFNELMQFVDTARAQPFFLMWTTPLPHLSLQAPERWVKHYVEKFGDEEPYIGNAGFHPCRYPHATYAAMVSYFDEQVGLLVEKLKREKRYDKTLIIFTSDNGPTFNGGTDSPWFNSGGPFKATYGWGKCFLHEGGIRVPTIATWHGHIAPGTESDHISAFQDVMPTLAEVAGVPCPPTDGISFLPTLLGKKGRQKQHPYLYWEYPDTEIGNKAIRMGKWKGIITNIQKGNTKLQLYNLEEDIREEHDVAAQHPDVVNRLRQLMEEAHKE